MADSIVPSMSKFESSLAEIQRLWDMEPDSPPSEEMKPFGPDVKVFLRDVRQRAKSRRWHVQRWNVFDILGRVRLEDAHSDVLAWLLAPWESHGLGTQVAEALLRAKWDKSLPGEEILSVKSRQAITGGVVDIEVRGQNWWLAVENKLDALESDGQTAKYTRYYAKRGTIGRNVFLLFLTPDGREAQEDRGRRSSFRPMSYSELREVLAPLSASTESGRFMIGEFMEQIMQHIEVG